MFIAELEHPRFADFDLTSLRTGIMAGSPCPVEVMKKVQADLHMDQVTICYGMTETSPVSFQPPPTTRSTSGSPPSAGFTLMSRSR
jgi:fatty-acyl-CoA synthase